MAIPQQIELTKEICENLSNGIRLSIVSYEILSDISLLLKETYSAVNEWFSERIRPYFEPDVYFWDDMEDYYMINQLSYLTEDQMIEEANTFFPRKAEYESKIKAFRSLDDIPLYRFSRPVRGNTDLISIIVQYFPNQIRADWVQETNEHMKHEIWSTLTKDELIKAANYYRPMNKEDPYRRKQDARQAFNQIETKDSYGNNTTGNPVLVEIMNKYRDQILDTERGVGMILVTQASILEEKFIDTLPNRTEYTSWSDLKSSVPIESFYRILIAFCLCPGIVTFTTEKDEDFFGVWQIPLHHGSENGDEIEYQDKPIAEDNEGYVIERKSLLKIGTHAYLENHEGKINNVESSVRLWMDWVGKFVTNPRLTSAPSYVAKYWYDLQSLEENFFDENLNNSKTIMKTIVHFYTHASPPKKQRKTVYEFKNERR